MDDLIRKFDEAVEKRAAFRQRAGLPHPVTLPVTIVSLDSLAFSDDADDLRIVDGVLYSGGEVWNALTCRGGV
jgi:hypothetical protein